MINFFLACMSRRKNEIFEACSSCLALLVHGVSERWMDDVHTSLLELSNEYDDSIATSLDEEWRNLRLTESVPIFPLPSAVPSEALRRYFSTMDRSALSADLLSDSIQTALIEEISGAFDGFFGVSEDQSRTDDQLERQLYVLEAEVILLTASPGATVKLRYEDVLTKFLFF